MNKIFTTGNVIQFAKIKSSPIRRDTRTINETCDKRKYQ